MATSHFPRRARQHAIARFASAALFSAIGGAFLLAIGGRIFIWWANQCPVGAAAQAERITLAPPPDLSPPPAPGPAPRAWTVRQAYAVDLGMGNPNTLDVRAGKVYLTIANGPAHDCYRYGPSGCEVTYTTRDFARVFPVAITSDGVRVYISAYDPQHAGCRIYTFSESGTYLGKAAILTDTPILAMQAVGGYLYYVVDGSDRLVKADPRRQFRECDSSRFPDEQLKDVKAGPTPGTLTLTAQTKTGTLLRVIDPAASLSSPASTFSVFGIWATCGFLTETQAFLGGNCCRVYRRGNHALVEELAQDTLQGEVWGETRGMVYDATAGGLIIGGHEGARSGRVLLLTPHRGRR